MMKKHYMSLATGELAFTKREIFRIAWGDLWKHHFLNLPWKVYRTIA